MAKQGERLAPSPGHNYVSDRVIGRRLDGAMTGKILIMARTTKQYRQEVADRMATVTETATVGDRVGNAYPVTFRVTHRILPIGDE